MAPRKAELLDLMRKQRAASGQRPAESPRPAPPPQPAPEPEPSPRRQAPRRQSPRRQPARLPWASLALVLLIAVPLVWWLTGALRGGGQPVEAGPDPASSSAPVDPAAGPGQPAPAAAKSFGVVAIQYDRTADNANRAVEVGKEVVGLLGLDFRLGQVVEFEDWIRIYFGRSDRSDDGELAALRDRLAALEYPPGSGRHEFRTAYVAPIPATR